VVEALEIVAKAGFTDVSGVYPKADANTLSAAVLVLPPAISFWIIVLEGSMVMFEPVVSEPAVTWAVSVLRVTLVVVASSGNVPPFASKTRSLTNSEVGMLTLNEPSAALEPERATSTPAAFTITTAPLAGPARTDPETVVVGVEELLPEPPPEQPNTASERQSSVMYVRC
jgi:hypothetical protein